MVCTNLRLTLTICFGVLSLSSTSCGQSISNQGSTNGISVELQLPQCTKDVCVIQAPQTNTVPALELTTGTCCQTFLHESVPGISCGINHQLQCPQHQSTLETARDSRWSPMIKDENGVPLARVILHRLFPRAGNRISRFKSSRAPSTH